MKFEKYKFVSFTFVFGLLVITLEPFELETSFLVCGYLVWRSRSWREILVFPFPVSFSANILRIIWRRTFIFGLWVGAVCGGWVGIQWHVAYSVYSNVDGRLAVSHLRHAHRLRCPSGLFLRLAITEWVTGLCFLLFWGRTYFLVLILSHFCCFFVNKKQPIFIFISIFYLVGLFWTQKRAVPRAAPAADRSVINMA